MPRFFALAFAGLAGLANVMQRPGYWDIWDIGAGALLVAAIATFIWGE